MTEPDDIQHGGRYPHAAPDEQQFPEGYFQQVYDNAVLREKLTTGYAVQLVNSGWTDSGQGSGIAWSASSDQPGAVQCLTCGAEYALQPGENVNFTDPRNCHPRKANGELA